MRVELAIKSDCATMKSYAAISFGLITVLRRTAEIQGSKDHMRGMGQS